MKILLAGILGAIAMFIWTAIAHMALPLGKHKNCDKLGHPLMETIHGMKYWEIIADNLSKAGFSWGCSSEIDSTGRVIFTRRPEYAVQL